MSGRIPFPVIRLRWIGSNPIRVSSCVQNRAFLYFFPCSLIICLNFSPICSRNSLTSSSFFWDYLGVDFSLWLLIYTAPHDGHWNIPFRPHIYWRSVDEFLSRSETLLPSLKSRLFLQLLPLESLIWLRSDGIFPTSLPVRFLRISETILRLCSG